MNTLTLILSIAIGIVIWVLYHKLFDVYYFNGLKALVAEFFVCWGLGGVIAGFILKYAMIAILIIAVIVGIVAMVSKGKNDETEGGASTADNTVVGED